MKRTTDITTATHYQWGNNCDSWLLMDTPSLSVKQELMPPGTKEVLHYHNEAQQFFYIISGAATFYIDGEREEVHPQQGIHIQPGSKHFIANETNETLSFLVISQPSTNNDRTSITQ